MEWHLIFTRHNFKELLQFNKNKGQFQVNLQQKIDYSIALIQKMEPTALAYQEFGYHVAFSGGKDSQVIYELCKMAGVKFKAFCYDTSICSPVLKDFIKVNYPDVTWIKPVKTMFQLILKHGSLPLRNIRYCCTELKERQGLNAIVVSGIRKAESGKRQKRKEFESSCVIGSDKNSLNAILDWTKRDVYWFLKIRNIPICSDYDTYKRSLGCIGCPQNDKEQRKALNNYTNHRRAYVNTVQKLINKGQYSEFENADDVITWWTSGLSVKKYMANKLQYKIGL
jgi:phosphoadenosine phosphosulfate reductase